MTTSPAIQVTDLYKSYANQPAVQGVSFAVQPGEIFSLLGPNGAGKTTTIAMLSTLLRPDQGDAAVMGFSVLQDPMRARAALGVVPQEIALYEDLTARENLAFWGKMYGLRGALLKQRVAEALEMIGLTGRADGQVGKFSGGMKRRVNIAAALLHRPAVIFMDEPTVGIDPQSRRNILDWVKALRDQGMTVLYTTHYMEEAQELSDHIAIMDHGRLIAQGALAELVKIVGQMDRIRLVVGGAYLGSPPLPAVAPLKVSSAHPASSANPASTANPADAHPGAPPVLDPGAPARDGLAQAWAALPEVRQVTVAPDEASGGSDGVFLILAQDSHQVLPRLFEVAASHAARVVSVEIQQPDLEAVFLHLTGRALRD